MTTVILFLTMLEPAILGPGVELKSTQQDVAIATVRIERPAVATKETFDHASPAQRTIKLGKEGVTPVEYRLVEFQ